MARLITYNVTYASFDTTDNYLYSSSNSFVNFADALKFFENECKNAVSDITYDGDIPGSFSLEKRTDTPDRKSYAYRRNDDSLFIVVELKVEELA